MSNVGQEIGFENLQKRVESAMVRADLRMKDKKGLEAKLVHIEPDASALKTDLPHVRTITAACKFSEAISTLSTNTMKPQSPLRKVAKTWEDADAKGSRAQGVLLRNASISGQCHSPVINNCMKS